MAAVPNAMPQRTAPLITRTGRNNCASLAPKGVTSRIVKPAGNNSGNTKRVTAAAAIKPLIEYAPSCARPGKPDGSSDAKPHTDVSIPRRIVGHRPCLQDRAASPGAPGKD